MQQGNGDIPVGHTWFSWNETRGKIPYGHSRFSWTASGCAHSSICGACDTNERGTSGEGEQQGTTIKKGFLEPKVVVPADVGAFLKNRVPEVIKRAEELHAAIEEDERKPFDKKYSARELLQGVSLQLAACKKTAEDEGVLEEWCTASARIDMLLGINMVETEENSSGEKKLNSAMGMHYSCKHSSF
jgi:hypothetical protein